MGSYYAIRRARGLPWLVRRGRARKYWVVWFDGDLVPRFPRAVQLFWLAVCAVWGHRWGAWACDDYDGPQDDVGPLLSRPAADADEWAYRACERECGTVEDRRP
jgi:hypothetical protein